MKDNFDDPFRAYDRLVKEAKTVHAIIVDFHAEASSEKKAFGYYVSGRASLVVGTHTHIPTADAQTLGERGTGYVTDLGMVGAKNSVLGVRKEEIIEGFLTQVPVKHTMVEAGEIVFNSIQAEIEGKQCLHIERVDRVVDED